MKYGSILLQIVSVTNTLNKYFGFFSILYNTSET